MTRDSPMAGPFYSLKQTLMYYVMILIIRLEFQTMKIKNYKKFHNENYLTHKKKCFRRNYSTL